MGRDGGELWREVWERMEDIGGGVTVVKVKAHTDEGAVGEGIITERDRYGNMQADAEAKRGARLAESLSPIGAARSELVKGMRWMGWVRRFAAVWRTDFGESDEEEGVRGTGVAVEGGLKGRAAAGLRHLIWERGLEWRCRRCGRVAATSQKRRDLQSSRCLGSAMGRLLQRTCSDAGAVERCCLERREDLISRGWKPRGGVEGGEAGAGGIMRTFEEEDEHEVDDRGAEEDGRRSRGGEEVIMEEDEGAGSTERGRRPAEVGESGSELAAAALAGGSGSATAAVAPAGPAVEAPLERETELPAHFGTSGPPGAALGQFTAPLGDLPELPTEEVRRVKARLGIGEACSGGSGAARSVGGLQRARETEAVAEAAHTLATAYTDCELGHEMGDGDLLDEEELYDEDPFGHVAADLALQPTLRQAESGDDGSARGTKRMAAVVVAGKEKKGRAAAEGDALLVPATRRPEEPRGAKRVAGQQPMDLEPKRARRGQGAGVREARQPADGQGGHEERRGRRYASLVADPVDGADAGGHQLRVSGPLIWCSRCGRYAMHRLRSTLRGACCGEATGAYSTRLVRLWAGRHPLTDRPLV